MAATLNALIIPVTPFQQNCTVMFDTETKHGVVVDRGGDIDHIREALEKNDIIFEAIWLTHGHIDHAGGAMELKEALGVEIIGPHKADKMLLDKLEDQAKMFVLPGTVRNVTPDRWLEEGETVTVGDLELEVFHCPGHTPGHVIFYHRPSKFALVGDVLFQGSIGRTDFPMGNHQDLIDAIVTKLWPLGDDVTFIPGHGPTSTFGQERKTNAFVSDYALS